MFERLNDQALKIERLTKGNEQLKQQLRGNEATPSASNDRPTAVDDSATSSEALCQLTEKYNDLTRKFQAATQKVKYLERKNQTVMQKNRDMKESVRAWQEYADRQSGKQKSKSEAKLEEGGARLSAVHHLQEDRPHMLSSPVSVPAVRTPVSLAQLGRSSPTPMAALPLPVTETKERLTSPYLVSADEHRSASGSETPKQPGRDRYTKQEHHDVKDHAISSPSRGRSADMNAEPPAYTYHQRANPSSSQTTEDETAEQMSRHAQMTDVEEDDDIPQFVSERSLKRKRGQPSKSRFEIYADRSSDGTPVKPFRVKEEPRSSPPPIAPNMTWKETFDLDDPALNGLKTPRHPRRKPSNYSQSTSKLNLQRANSAPFSQRIKGEEIGVESLSEAHACDVLEHTVGERVLQGVISELRAFSEPSDPTQAVEGALRSLDQNTLSSASDDSPRKRTRRAELSRPSKHNILAESGESPPSADDDELRLPPSRAREQLNRKLQTSKKHPSPATRSYQTPQSPSTKIKVEQDLTPSTTRNTATPSAITKLRNTVPKARSKPRDTLTPSDRQIWTMKAPSPRSSTRSRTSPPKQQHQPQQAQGPLRDRPTTSLTIQDFKPNPAFNQGYTHAFSETVRTRSARMCLPGCTNPTCCGSTFRTFAAAQGALPASQEEALLEDYLGAAYEGVRMSGPERAELVLQARTKKMAGESGRHREAYERRRTPPGFWRVDFPTTQEVEGDRERAREGERAVVQERWLEAQRKGGRWVFRDE